MPANAVPGAGSAASAAVPEGTSGVTPATVGIGRAAGGASAGAQAHAADLTADLTTDGVVVTGDPHVDRVLAPLTGVEDLALAEQLAVFESVHAGLQGRLTEAEG